MDPEKLEPGQTVSPSETKEVPATVIGHDHVVDANDVGEIRVMEIRQGNSVLRWLRDLETRMDKKLKFEGQGIERIPEDQRKSPGLLNIILLWFSMIFSPAMIPMGMLGPIFGISLSHSIIISVFAGALGSLLPSFTATLSAPTGLRQIAVSRYAFGIWGAKLCGLLNIIVNCGFGVVNCIVAGQLLAAVSDGKLPLAVGIIIISALSFVISFFGFHVLHTYERYAWIIVFILLCVQYGEAARYFGDVPSSVTGIDYTGSCLSYFAIIFGEATGWSSMSGDYYVHFPPKTSKWLIFWFTEIGLTVPTVFVCILGNCYGSIIMTNDDLSNVYDDGGIGGLILATLRPNGFGKFICVIYVLSFLGNLIAIIYSSALSIQLWGTHFHAVPRFIWCGVLTAIILALAWGGRDVLETILNNFLSILGYWTVCFSTILFEEHFIFRRAGSWRKLGYDVTAWQDQARMPWGIAGVLALLIGIAGSFLGMDQTWYIGIVARKIGADGGDTGDYFAFIFCGVMYPILRTLELKYFGR